MKIVILVGKTTAGWSAETQYPNTACEGADKEGCINFCRGACLIALSERKVVPTEILFEVLDA